MLATRSVEEKKTAVHIRAVVTEILDEFDAARDNNVYVTDNGSNVKAAFKDQAWLSCSGHNLNLAVSQGLDAKRAEGLPLAAAERHTDVTDLVQAAKDVVTKIKRTQMQQQLKTTLKQVCVKFV